MKECPREKEALNNMRLAHNQRLEIPTFVAIMIVADRRLRAMSALMGSTIRRQQPAVKSGKGAMMTERCLLQKPAIQNESAPYIVRCSCTGGSNPPNGF